MRKKQLILR